MLNVKKDAITKQKDKHKNITSIEIKVRNKFLTPTTIPKYAKPTPLRLIKKEGKFKKLLQIVEKKSNIFIIKSLINKDMVYKKIRKFTA